MKIEYLQNLFFQMFTLFSKVRSSPVQLLTVSKKFVPENNI